MNDRNPSSRVALITGGVDRHYVCALARALAASGVALDLLGTSEMGSEVSGLESVKLFVLYPPHRPELNAVQKLFSFLGVYLRLVRYAATSSAQTFHIFWEYKFPFIDRTLLPLYYKLLGKRIVFTAHNVNRAERDGVDTFYNRLSLLIQYRLVDHIFVHTKTMKDQLAGSFNISQGKVTVIPFGSGGMVPNSGLTSAEAKKSLGLGESDRVILFFGRIAKYKGLDLLVDSFERLAISDRRYRLIIAGDSTSDWAGHWREVRDRIESGPIREQVLQVIRHIPDDAMEVYFKAADVLALPYRQIFQSGVLFMSHSFGLPVIAADVDAFRDEIVEGTNGFLCRPNDPEDLARAIERYFSSELYRTLEERRPGIQELLRSTHSWEIVAKLTSDVYDHGSQHASLKPRGPSAGFTGVSLSRESDIGEPLDS